MLKGWDGWYLKHIKSAYVEMNNIHTTCMKPLTNLLESNLNFHFLEQIEKKKKDVPKFRHEALETKFCGHLSTLCQIFATYGVLKDHFDIKQMLHILKIKDWETIPPIAFYLKPLKDALDDVRKELIDMNNLGVLRCRYIIEDNEEL